MVATTPCPSCHRVDAVAKVSSVVTAGTTRTDESVIQFGPSLSEDGLDWSITYEGVIVTSRTDLAEQLSFPPKGTVAVGITWTLFVISTIASLLAFRDRTRLIDESATRVLNSTELRDLRFDNAFLLVALAVACLAALTGLIATSVHFAGRKRAEHVWQALYYCFRDDIVYAPSQPSNYASRVDMRRKLLGY